MSSGASHISTPDNTDAIPRPEHPRPDFLREPWANLNGRWRFTLDPENIGEQRRWHRKRHPDTVKDETERAAATADTTFNKEILVPFPWESELSGIGETEYKGAAWYQRTVTVPEEWAEALPEEPETASGSPVQTPRVKWKLRPFLCFGAVDWSAKVWVNGRFVGEHHGGYNPFVIDLSHFVTPGRPATLTVRAHDACDADTLLGKQTYDWYTHSGGIWQTVWMEGRPHAYLSQIHITPHLEEGRATFNLAVSADSAGAGKTYKVTVESADGSFDEAAATVNAGAGHTELSLDVSVPEPRAWSPEDPHLYECTVRLVPEGGDGGDVVQTYFGLRTISRGQWRDNPYEFVFLNGEPVYLRGALDQAFTPEGLHTYPSDDAIRRDVQLAKDLGLNMLRCHIKMNEPRYYYWADKLGVLVMYDIPCASLYTTSARAHWEKAFRAALARDYSHPSIFAWILFNETWGLEEHQTAASWKWVAEMYGLAKALDPTRLAEDNSVCMYDHVKTDINSWHFYIGEYDRARREISRVVDQTYEGSPFNYVARLSHVKGAETYKQGREPFMNSEYAGLGASGGDKDISYTFKYLTTELRRHAKVCGYVYTELTDIEWEHNGFVNYDRSAKEFGYDAFLPGMSVRDLTAADFVGLDCPPCQTLAPGETFSAPAFVSHWDRRHMPDATLRWRVTSTDGRGEQSEVATGERAVSPAHYGVTDAGTIEVTAPNAPGLLTVAFWLEDGEENVRARNYVNVDVHPSGQAQEDQRTDGGIALKFLPGDFSDSSWPQPSLGPRGSKFGAGGAGWVEYRLELPEGIDLDRVKGLRLAFEAGARTAHNRIGWKTRRYGDVGNYPQTEEEIKFPTDLMVSVNGVALTEEPVRLPDDPADARGVLSAHLSPRYEFCSYGFLTRLEVADADRTKEILNASGDGSVTVRFEVPRGGKKTGGLNLYGSRLGAYPVDPTLFLDVE